jgi:hypothetical protein
MLAVGVVRKAPKAIRKAAFCITSSCLNVVLAHAPKAINPYSELGSGKWRVES